MSRSGTRRHTGPVALCVVVAILLGACQSDPRYMPDDRALATSIGDELLTDDVDDPVEAVLGDVSAGGDVSWWLPGEETYAEHDKGVVQVSAPADLDAPVDLRLQLEAVGTRSRSHGTTGEVMQDGPVFVSSVDVWSYVDAAAARDGFREPSSTFPDGLEGSDLDSRCVAHHGVVVDQYGVGVYARGVASHFTIEVGVASAVHTPETRQIEAAENYVCELLDRVLDLDGVE